MMLRTIDNSIENGEIYLNGRVAAWNRSMLAHNNVNTDEEIQAITQPDKYKSYVWVAWKKKEI